LYSINTKRDHCIELRSPKFLTSQLRVRAIKKMCVCVSEAQRIILNFASRKFYLGRFL
jgi:hypothetical protein